MIGMSPIQFLQPPPRVMPHIALMMVLNGALTGNTPAHAAEFTLKPVVAMSEEFTTSVEESDTNQQKDWITRTQPGVLLHYLAPRWTWDLSYNLDYRHYARSTKGDTTDHKGRLAGNVTAIDNLLFIEVSDTYQLVSNDVSTNYADESITRNQETQNAAMASAYFLLRPIDRTQIKTGYRYNDTRYIDGDGIDKSEHICFADMTYELTPKFTLLTGYLFSQNATYFTDITKHEVYGGFRFQYAEKSYLYGQGGMSWQDFSPGGKVDNPTWSGGINHAFERTTVILDTKTQFTEDPQSTSTQEIATSIRVERQLMHGSVSFGSSYREFYRTRTDTLDSRSVAFNVAINQELTDGVRAALTGSAENITRHPVTDPPYRFVISPTVSAALNYDMTLGLTYSYITYRQALQETAGNREIHRAIVELRKLF